MANDQYRDVHQFEAEPPARKKNNWATGCLIGCLAVLVVALLIGGIAAVWISRNWKQWAAAGISEGVKQTINTTDLPAEEKIEINAEIDRAAKAFADGQMSGEQAGRLVERVFQSPLITVIIASATEKKYIAPSGLSDEEKAEASVTLQRFARGVLDKKIDEPTIESVISNIAVKKGDQWELRDNVTDEELRKFLAAAKTAADDAGVAEQPPKIDPSEEIKRIVDEALSDDTAVSEPPPLEMPPAGPASEPPAADAQTN